MDNGTHKTKFGHIEERIPNTDWWMKVFYEVDQTTGDMIIASHLMKGNESMMCDEMPPHPIFLKRETVEKLLQLGGSK